MPIIHCYLYCTTVEQIYVAPEYTAYSAEKKFVGRSCEISALPQIDFGPHFAIYQHIYACIVSYESYNWVLLAYQQ